MVPRLGLLSDLRTPGRVAPGPRPQFFLGHLHDFRKDPLHFLLNAAEKYGDVVGLWMGKKRGYLLRHPDHIQHVLQTNHRNYGKRTKALERVGLVLGQGLVTSDGELWQRQRRTMQPAFHHERISAFAPTVVRLTEELLERWRVLADSGQAIDIAQEMMRLAFSIIGETLLSTDISREADTVRRALAVLQGQANDRLYSLFSLPLWIPTPSNKTFRSALRALDSFIYDLIAKRRTEERPPSDLLTTLMSARDEESGERMNNRQIRDETLTILLAGHENTGNALGWMWYLISQHPEVERRLHVEVAEVLDGRPPTWADLPKLAYARMVVEESLRLYPTSWLNIRTANDNDELGGYLIPRGSLVFISPFVTHRHPKYWSDPEAFEPERFTESQRSQHHRFAYFPFGGGPRKCIGSNFAMNEAQLIIATIAQRYCLRLVPGHPVHPHPVISLPAKHGLPMTIHSLSRCGNCEKTERSRLDFARPLLDMA